MPCLNSHGMDNILEHEWEKRSQPLALTLLSKAICTLPNYLQNGYASYGGLAYTSDICISNYKS